MSTVLPSRARPTWPELPAPVRAALEVRIGSSVTGWTSHDGGYTPGMASTLRTADGEVFVKAVPTRFEFAARMYRQEADRSAALPADVPAPRLRWSLEIPGAADGAGGAGEGWVALAFEPVAGRGPRVPLVGEELGAVVRLAGEVGSHEVGACRLPDAATEVPAGCTTRLADVRPAGLGTYDPWLAANLDRLAGIEAELPAAVAGTRLVHGDLRGDNAIILSGRRDRAVAVDWPFAARGAPFVNLVAMLPAVHAGGGPPPHEVLARTALPGAPDDAAVTTWLSAITGYFVESSLQPPPRGIPHVRAFQRAQGEVCVDWLRRRLS